MPCPLPSYLTRTVNSPQVASAEVAEGTTFTCSVKEGILPYISPGGFLEEVALELALFFPHFFRMTKSFMLVMTNSNKPELRKRSIRKFSCPLLSIPSPREPLLLVWHLSFSRSSCTCICECENHSVMSNSLRPLDCSPSGSSVHGILQARILEWVAILFFRGSSRPKDQTWVSCIAGRFFTVWATKEACIVYIYQYWYQVSRLLNWTGVCLLDAQQSHPADHSVWWWEVQRLLQVPRNRVGDKSQLHCQSGLWGRIFFF